MASAEKDQARGRHFLGHPNVRSSSQKATIRPKTLKDRLEVQKLTKTAIVVGTGQREALERNPPLIRTLGRPQNASFSTKHRCACRVIRKRRCLWKRSRTANSGCPTRTLPTTENSDAMWPSCYAESEKWRKSIKKRQNRQFSMLRHQKLPPTIPEKTCHIFAHTFSIRLINFTTSLVLFAASCLI